MHPLQKERGSAGSKYTHNVLGKRQLKRQSAQEKGWWRCGISSWGAAITWCSHACEWGSEWDYKLYLKQEIMECPKNYRIYTAPTPTATLRRASYYKPPHLGNVFQATHPKQTFFFLEIHRLQSPGNPRWRLKLNPGFFTGTIYLLLVLKGPLLDSIHCLQCLGTQVLGKYIILLDLFSLVFFVIRFYLWDEHHRAKFTFLGEDCWQKDSQSSKSTRKTHVFLVFVWKISLKEQIWIVGWV